MYIYIYIYNIFIQMVCIHTNMYYQTSLFKMTCSSRFTPSSTCSRGVAQDSPRWEGFSWLAAIWKSERPHLLQGSWISIFWSGTTITFLWIRDSIGNWKIRDLKDFGRWLATNLSRLVAELPGRLAVLPGTSLSRSWRLDEFFVDKPWVKHQVAVNLLLCPRN